MVARVSQNTDLVLYLHGQHSVILCIHFLDVLHQGRESAPIGLLGCCARRTQNLHFIARQHHPRKATRIALDPHRRITRHAVLPRGQPQKYDVQMLLAGLRKETVHQHEIELAFRWLYQFPTQRSHHRVQPHRCQPGPNRLHMF